MTSGDTLNASDFKFPCSSCGALVFTVKDLQAVCFKCYEKGVRPPLNQLDIDIARLVEIQTDINRSIKR